MKELPIFGSSFCRDTSLFGAIRDAGVTIGRPSEIARNSRVFREEQCFIACSAVILKHKITGRVMPTLTKRNCAYLCRQSFTAQSLFRTLGLKVQFLVVLHRRTSVRLPFYPILHFDENRH
jgi:hypothetical protein